MCLVKPCWVIVAKVTNILKRASFPALSAVLAKNLQTYLLGANACGSAPIDCPANGGDCAQILLGAKAI